MPNPDHSPNTTIAKPYLRSFTLFNLVYHIHPSFDQTLALEVSLTFLGPSLEQPASFSRPLASFIHE